MRWEERLLGVFEDLEQQAEGLALDERDATVAGLAPAAYAGVDLASRLHASVGRAVRLDVTGHGRLAGRVARVGSDWLLLEGPQAVGAGTAWLVRTAAVVGLQGASAQAREADARAVTSRLGLGSALRGLAEERLPVRLLRLDGSQLRGLLGRVGADFVEVLAAGAGEPDELVLVPFAGLALVSQV
jgi:hypothetical protein